jgi:hypothetical protein
MAPQIPDEYRDKGNRVKQNLKCLSQDFEWLPSQ